MEAGRLIRGLGVRFKKQELRRPTEQLLKMNH